MQYMRKLWNFFTDVQDIKYVLWGTYFCPNSIEIEN